MERTVYKSAVSTRLVIAFWTIPLLSMLPVLLIDFSWGLVITSVAVSVIITIPLFCLQYIIEGHTLTVKFLFFSIHSYDINEITTITPTRSFLSAPAASLNRIEIGFTTGNTPLIISPKRQHAFVEHLLQLNPTIVSHKMKL